MLLPCRVVTLVLFYELMAFHDLFQDTGRKGLAAPIFMSFARIRTYTYIPYVNFSMNPMASLWGSRGVRKNCLGNQGRHSEWMEMLDKFDIKRTIQLSCRPPPRISSY